MGQSNKKISTKGRGSAALSKRTKYNGNNMGEYPTTVAEKVIVPYMNMRLSDVLRLLQEQGGGGGSHSSFDDSFNESFGAGSSAGGGILTVDGRKWATAYRSGAGPLSKAEAMEFLGWTEEQFDAVLAEPSEDGLPKPCAVFFNGYNFPQQIIEDSVFVGAVVYIPGMHYNSESYEVVFDMMYIAIQDSRPRGGDSEVVDDKLYTIYGLAEVESIDPVTTID